ncbi:cysteine desulfurase NifS [Candidatus Pacearchaeota archaeon CG10_big_fil_rev_8_21_14_0_10_32_42]|nr:MAG: cysteine desulfurase NifS [Candidatus Pacearchaeota archaeon CG10_big_fil_rev_8_21_14_0_10_32_42]
MKPIYLDNAATTKLDKEVLKSMQPYLKEFYGNPSSAHIKGQETKNAIEKARKIIANSINAKSEEIYFTSGGTESNNWTMKGIFFKSFPKKNQIITTKIEHDSIIKTCKWLEKIGAKVIFLNVNREGFIDLKELEKSITKKTMLVSIMHANNEIGTIQNIEEIGKICKKKGVIFHTDAAQSFTKIPLDVKNMNLDLVTLNAHKIYGPKGIGALFIKEGTLIESLLHGGGHERNLRSGTENVPGIVGFGKAVELSKKIDCKKISKLRNFLIEEIIGKIPNSKLNGPKENRLPNNANIFFENTEGEAVGAYLENYRIYVSTGSACMSNTGAESHVLKAIRLSPKEQDSSIRFTLGKDTTEKEIKYVVKTLLKIIEKMRKAKEIKND